MSLHPEADAPREPLHEAVARVVGPGMSVGGRAELRRADPDRSPPATFWQVTTSVTSQRLGDDELPAWICALQAAAELASAGTGRLRLGEALAEAQYAEARLVRLLRAEGKALFQEVRTAARFLAHKGVAANPYDFADLVTARTPSRREHLNNLIADSYYRRLHKTHSEES